LERQLGDQTALSHDAVRRAERAELALIEVEEKLANVDESLQQREHVQRQLMTDRKQVCTACFKTNRTIFCRQ